MDLDSNRIIRKRYVRAFLSSVVSISLVLLLVGIAAFLLVSERSVSDYLKENMQVSVMMKRDVGESAALRYKKVMDTEPFVRSSSYVSKEQGAKEMAQLLGDDFLAVFETAPIPVSINLTLKSEYVSPDSLEVVKAVLEKAPEVEEVVYQQSLVEALNSNLSKISLFLAVFIALLLFISFVLINNTVRLGIYARRFSIHTMKLVGASWSFIRGPFVRRAVGIGLLASVLACAALGAIYYALFLYEPEILSFLTWDVLAITAGVVFAFGIAITAFCATISVNKFLRMKAGELYKI